MLPPLRSPPRTLFRNRFLSETSGESFCSGTHLTRVHTMNTGGSSKPLSSAFPFAPRTVPTSSRRRTPPPLSNVIVLNAFAKRSAPNFRSMRSIAFTTLAAVRSLILVMISHRVKRSVSTNRAFDPSFYCKLCRPPNARKCFSGPLHPGVFRYFFHTTHAFRSF